MSEQEFQAQVLAEFAKLNGQIGSLEWRFDTLEGKFDKLEWKFDTLEWKVDRLSEDFGEFKSNQEQFNTAIWNLNTQAFQSINDVRNEVVSPWKLRKWQN